MRYLTRLLFIFLLSVAAYAQNTTVTGTITDPDGTAWANGSITASLNNPRTGSIYQGTTLITAAQQQVNINLDNTGSFTTTLFDNTKLTPVGTSWNFNVCPATGTACTTVFNITISGTSQSLTTSLSSQIPVVRFPAGPFARGYTDTEVSPTPPPGGTYYNLISSTLRIWNGTAWGALTGGGGSITFPNGLLRGNNTTQAPVAAALSDLNTFIFPTCTGGYYNFDGTCQKGTVNQLVALDSNGKIVSLAEYQTQVVNGAAVKVCEEDLDKGEFDVRCPKYGPGGVYGANPQQAFQDVANAMICYGAIVGKHPTLRLPPGSYKVGTASNPVLKFPAGGNYYGAGASINGGGTLFQATYNNNTAVQFNTGQSAICPSDGLSHTSNISGGFYIGLAEHGCSQGGCVQTPGDTGNYNSGGGPNQNGFFFGDSQGHFESIATSNNGGWGTNLNGQDSRTGDVWGYANLQWWIYNANGAPLANAPTSLTVTPSTTGGTLNATTYYYKVTTETNAVVGGTGESLPGTEQSATTTTTTSSVNVSWPAVTNAIGYKVYRGTSTGNENLYYNTLLSAPSNLTGSIATTGGNLHQGIYYYKVTALNAVGETTGSNELQLVTSNTTSVNNLSWNAVPGATSYKVYLGYPAGNESAYITTTATTYAHSVDNAFSTSGTVPTTNSTGTVTSYVDTGATLATGTLPTTNTTNYNPAGDSVHGDVMVIGVDNQVKGVEVYGGFNTIGAEYNHVAGLLMGGGASTVENVFNQLTEIGVWGLAYSDGMRIHNVRIDAPHGDGIVMDANGVVSDVEIFNPCTDGTQAIAALGHCSGIRGDALNAKYSNIQRQTANGIFPTSKASSFFWGAGQIQNVDGPYEMQKTFADTFLNGLTFPMQFGYNDGGDVTAVNNAVDISLRNGIHPADTVPTTYKIINNAYAGQSLYVRADNPNATFAGPLNGGHWHNCAGGDINLGLGGAMIHYVARAGLTNNGYTNGSEMWEDCNPPNYNWEHIDWAGQTTPALSNIYTQDIFGGLIARKIPSITMLSDGNYFYGTNGSYQYCYAGYVNVAGGVLTTNNVCTNLDIRGNNRIKAGMIIPSNWMHWELWCTSSTDPGVSPGLLAQADASANGPGTTQTVFFDEIPAKGTARINTTTPTFAYSLNTTGGLNEGRSTPASLTEFCNINDFVFGFGLGANSSTFGMYLCTAPSNWVFYPMGGGTATGNYLPLTGGTTTGPITVNDSTGVGGGQDNTEGTVPAGAVNIDKVWADATSHWLKMNNNNTGAQSIVGITTVGTPGHAVKLDANGKDIIDSGFNSVYLNSGTPTYVAAAGAGTSPTISFSANSTDDAGWINLTEGTSPTASVGIVTVTFAGTYSTARRCSVSPSNAAAAALTGTATTFVPSTQSTTTNFVMFGGATTLTTGTVYQFFYRCY